MTGILINGEWQAGRGSELRSLNPATGEVLWAGYGADEQQVREAVAAASQAQPSWYLTPLAERKRLLENFAETVQDNTSELAKAISNETGKPLWESTQEVTAMINKIAISISAQQQRAADHSEVQWGLQHRPLGVMAVFGPYNFPGHLPNGHIVPALLAGNSIVFKPSEKTPAVAELTLQLWRAAGLPPGVINLLHGDASVGRALINAAVQGVLFTGSYRVGAEIHRQLAGRPEVLLALEMGGNNPLIVDRVGNIEVAAWHIIRSAFISSGQRCTCARRLILVANNANSVFERVIQILPQLQIGAWQEEPFMGPLIDEQAAMKVLDTQKKLLQIGGRAKLLARHRGNAFISPGVITMPGVKNLYDEEIFGPLLQVYRVADFDEAITLANDTRFGLAAGLLSDNISHQEKFLQHIRAGVVSINQPTAGASSTLPFGGVGHSGNYRPSASYAADYCAWPQAQTLGTATHEQQPVIPQGFMGGANH
ncbi:succinylglutamic semialdehyde dehydrogenase [Alteromonadaceae bacterium 2753L.S.0a.02]|nr:succinylglutamic semialdehyde dehydrogenase [Alteromonadaceae bacterium 2753L.S.0a.02]